VGPKGDWTLWEREKTFSFAWNRTHASDRPHYGPAIILDYPSPTTGTFRYRMYRLQSKSHF